MTGEGGAEAVHDPLEAQQLREANEALVLATLHAQAMAAASEQAAARVQEANEHLVVTTVHAQMMTELAQQATVQLAFRSRLEAQLLEARKLETLGVLAGGVAHDFNNLITTIMGYTEMGRLAVERGSEPARCFAAIDQAAKKAGELTRQLLAYSGKGAIQTAPVDLAIVVKEIAQLLSVSIPSQVTLQFDFADRLPLVKGDPTQIFQIVMNLITNASEACAVGNGGWITLRTRARQIDAADQDSAGWILPPLPGPYATLEVADTGAGMTPEVLGRIFEPFFTTKAAGHGLGLAAVVGILRGHGGGLKVFSEPGRGSSFTLYLPAPPIWFGPGDAAALKPLPQGSLP
ncbi:MAG: ATP-binding protein [Holophaga sp.]|nr:ATP-binding protein [Holophaga sp.]